MRQTATDVARSVHGPCGATVNCLKTAEPIEMPLWEGNSCGPKKLWVQIPQREGTLSGDDSGFMAAMRLVAKLLCPILFVCNGAITQRNHKRKHNLSKHICVSSINWKSYTVNPRISAGSRIDAGGLDRLYE